MANPEHLAILKQGVEAWNKWRAEHPDIEPDFSESDLQMTDLSGAKLYRADFYATNLTKARLNNANLGGAGFAAAQLYGADLSASHLEGAAFVKANLDEANLTKAELTRADFSGASLKKTIFKEAILIGSVFSNALLKITTHMLDGSRLGEPDVIHLSGADFSDAMMGWTIFNDVDLSDVIGLDTVSHCGASVISTDTIFKSRNLPPAFLLGCGVPQQFVDYIPSLIGAVEPFQYHSCFISYSTKEEEFAQRLYSRLRDAKVRVWCSSKDIKGGEKLFDQMERAIQLHDRLLLVLSENSIKSGWVETEIRKAVEIERKEKRRKLFPIRLTDVDTIKEWRCFDADTGKDLAVEVREYFIPDFSNWKDHDSFEKEFERLLSDLKNAEPHKEKVAFTTSVVFDEEEYLPAFVIPQKENLKLTTRLSDLSSLGRPLIREKETTQITISKPTNFDEIVIFCGELIQYKILTDLDEMQKGGWTVLQMSGTVSSEVKNPVKTSDLVKLSAEEMAQILLNNRFSTGISENLRWEYSSLLVPSGSKVSLQHLPSSEKTGADKRMITLEKQNFFKAEITIQTMGASTPSILPSGLRLPSNKAAKCRTYQFAVTLEAEFDNQASGTRQMQEYKTWLIWLFSEIQKRLSD